MQTTSQRIYSNSGLDLMSLSSLSLVSTTTLEPMNGEASLVLKALQRCEKEL